MGLDLERRVTHGVAPKVLALEIPKAIGPATLIVRPYLETQWREVSNSDHVWGETERNTYPCDRPLVNEAL